MTHSRLREMLLIREQHRRDGLTKLLVVRNESIADMMRHLFPDFIVQSHDKAMTTSRQYEVIVLALGPSMDYYAEVAGQIRNHLKPDGQWIEL